MRLSFLWVAASMLVPALAPAAPPTAPARPKLVAVVVIDQLAMEGLQRMRPYLGKGGFERLMKEGAFFSQTYYAHQNTYCCVPASKRWAEAVRPA